MSSAEVVKAETTTPDNGPKTISATRGRGDMRGGRGAGRGAGGPMRSDRGRGGSHPYESRGGRGGPRGRVMIDYYLIHLKVLNERPTEFMNYRLVFKRTNNLEIT